MKVYLSGPMSGRPDHNFARFDAASNDLRVLGHEVVSPADLTRKTWARNGSRGVFEAFLHTEEARRAYFLRQDVGALLGCDAIIMIDTKWTTSRGATLEALVARSAGLRFGTFLPGFSDIVWADQNYTLAVTVLADVHAKAAVGQPFEGLTSDWLPRPDKDEWLWDFGDKGSGLPSEHATLAETDSVCAEADRLVDGSRQQSYGHPLDNFTRIAYLWYAYLAGKYRSGEMTELTAEDAAAMMVLLKVARLEHDYHRDSVVDIAGYAKVLELIAERRKA